MATTKLIPLAEQPAYQEAVGKVAHISAALNRTTEDLQRLQDELYQLKNRQTTTDDGSSMARAMAIADGKTGSDTLIPSGLNDEIERLTQRHKALRAGLIEANKVADAIAEQLARKVATDAKSRHMAAVKHVLECLEQLCNANEAEERIRTDLEKLGYHRHGLQAHGFTAAGRIDDWTGSPAYYFNKEARQYLNSH